MPPPFDRAARWPEIEARFEELLELSPDQRSAAIEAIDDPDLARELERLVAALEDSDNLFSGPVANAFPMLVSAIADHQSPGGASEKRVGSYRLIRVLGRGGMGVVYLGERADASFEKQVAVKVLPRGLETTETQRRFLLERQMLARLEHPNVARLLDGGVTDEGTPFLVMELVDGVSLDDWCTHKRLPLRQRIELFLQVCEAVQYAHRNMIVHRDLKPRNILVTPEGEVKLLDFGIAKLMEGEEGATLTRVQPRTTAYAAPEQIAGKGISTASDVYSLGVILYALLTEAPPYPLEGLSAAAAGRMVLEREPTRPSVAASEVASLPGSWRRRLVGDLDRILLKALEKEPDRRYATTEALAEDLRRYLDGRPVEAREPTWTYRAQRFVQRHKVGSMAALLVVLAVLVAIVGIAWQARRATAEADRANRVASFLVELFRDADPFKGSGDRDMTVTELLERGERRVRQELSDDARVYADLLEAIGLAYQGQGRSEKAVALQREILETRRELYPDAHAMVTQSMVHLGSVLEQQGLYEEAEPILLDAMNRVEAAYGPNAPELAEVLTALGALRNQQGDYPESVELYEHALQIRRSTADEDDLSIALALHGLSGSLDLAGEDEKGIELLRQALAIAGETLSPDHPFIAMMGNDLGVRLTETGDYQRAIASFELALSTLEKRLGVDSPGTADSLSNLGRTHLTLGDVDAAAPYIERAAGIHTRNLAPNHFNRIGAEINLASLRREQGRLDESESIYRSALVRFEDLVGPHHQATARVRTLLAGTLHLQDELEEAADQYRTALEDSRSPQADPYRLSDTLIGLGSVLGDLGEPEAAVTFLREGLALRVESTVGAPWQIAEAEMELGAVLAQLGKTSEATQLLASSLPGLLETFPEGTVRRARIEAIAAQSDAFGDQ